MRGPCALYSLCNFRIESSGNKVDIVVKCDGMWRISYGRSKTARAGAKPSSCAVKAAAIAAIGFIRLGIIKVVSTFIRDPVQLTVIYELD